ncbi:MAG: DUF2269 family protein [Dehalococcoidia bacterium]
MPESYEWALFFHLLGVFLISGAAVSSVLVLAFMRRSRNVQELRLWANLAVIVDRIFPLAIIVLIVAGIWLVEDRDWSWGDGWINVSLIGLILMTVFGFLVITRKLVAIDTAAGDAPDGAIPQVLAAQIHDPVLFGGTHALTMGVLAIMWNMTTKPGDAQAGIVLLAAIIIGAASAYPMVQRQQAIMEGKRQ